MPLGTTTEVCVDFVFGDQVRQKLGQSAVGNDLVVFNFPSILYLSGGVSATRPLSCTQCCSVCIRR